MGRANKRQILPQLIFLPINLLKSSYLYLFVNIILSPLIIMDLCSFICAICHEGPGDARLRNKGFIQTVVNERKRVKKGKKDKKRKKKKKKEKKRKKKKKKEKK